MEQYLIDTNAVPDYFTASFPAAGVQFMDTAMDAVPNLSVIRNCFAGKLMQLPHKK
jgi:hypothetical protein